MPSPVESTSRIRPFLTPRFTGRLLQSTFLGLFLFATALLLLLEPGAVLNPSFGAGVALILIASALPFLRLFDVDLYRPWMLAMPLLDFLAFVFLRLDAIGGVTNPMIMMLMIPAAWFGLASSRRALVLMVPAVVAVVIPDLSVVLAGGLSESITERTLVVIIVFPIVAIFAAGAAQTMAWIITERQSALLAEQRRRADAAHDTERARMLLDSVLDSLDAGVVVLSPDGEPLLLNRALRESPTLAASGDPWEAFRTVAAYELDRVTPVADCDRTISRLARGQFVRDRLIWLGPPGGDQRAMSVSSRPVLDEGGEHLASVILVSDVTEFVGALDAKDAFIGTVSHELRTPLTTMSGFLEMIMERAHELDPELVTWLEVMERSVQRQQLLVRDLLEAAGTRTAAPVIRRLTADLGIVAANAAAAVAPEAKRKGVEVRIEASTAEGSFDPHRLAQVAENLLTNAVRYTPEGGQIEIATADRGDHIALQVRDTGPGIPAEEQERLFERFFRGQLARSSAIRGVGLGLSIVQAIIDAHDGEIDIDSEPGRGTAVTVRLPKDLAWA